MKVCSKTGSIVLDLDDSPEAFDAIHKYLHNPDFSVDLFLLPTICKIAKKYQFHDVWRTLGGLLAASISLENIGEVCPLVALSYDQTIEDTTSQQLTLAIRSFLIANADTIASSQTGQLSARLFIDVLESLQIGDLDEGFPDDAVDWNLLERVLLYSSHQVRDQDPRTEGNCFTFGDKTTRKLNNKIYASAVDTVTDEIRMTILDTQLRYFDKMPLFPFSLSSWKAEEDAEMSRQTCSISEAIVQTPPIQGIFPTDKETCLLAKTSLGVGSISIYLGKLRGRLVTISAKRRCAALEPNSSTSSSAAGGINGVMYPVVFPVPTSSVPQPPLAIKHNVIIPSEPSTQDSDCFSEGSHSDCILQKSCILRSFGCFSTPLLEARSTAGACTICSTIEDGKGEANKMLNHFVLIAGGTSHDRCLNSTEILRISRPLDKVDRSSGQGVCVISPNSDFDCLSTQSGPTMRSPRGRLGLAALERASCIYAFGGCDGNHDLSTAECLSFDSMDEYHKKWRFVSSMRQERSCCAVATWSDESLIVVMGGQCEGFPLSNVEAYYPDSDRWFSLPSMSKARSHLCAATLSQRNLIVAVGGVSETANTPSTQPSNSSNPNVLEFARPSSEAYDSRCAHWIRLPELLNRGPLIGAALVSLFPSSDRLFLIGGSDGLSTMTQIQIFDSRAWSWLPGPSLMIGRASSCAVSLVSPFVQSDTVVASSAPYIAVIGGYNLPAGGFLNSVEVVGGTSNSWQTSPLTESLNAFPRLSNSTHALGVSFDTPLNPPHIPAHHDIAFA